LGRVGERNVDTTKELPTVVAFCAGYGGIERGLDLAGVKHRVVAYVEIEAFAIANLVAKMETGQLDPAPIYTDLKTFPAEVFRDRVDIITGGYPCQPFSAAGKRKGEDDPRHLWPYIRRHIESIRPVQCFFENVEGHISLGLSTVVSDLEEDGYTATWGIFSAREVGAPHQRKRVYIMANSNSGFGRQGGYQQPEQQQSGGLCQDVSNTSGIGLQGRTKPSPCPGESETAHQGGETARTHIQRGQHRSTWEPEPRLGRVVDGCANRVDRLRLLGNAVVPQTAARAYETLMRRYQ
jgi:DNA (cytosine-5)-methyltransferase 1